MHTYTSHELAQLIRNAAEYLREHGLCKTGIDDSQGRVCIARAINQASEHGLFDRGLAASDAVNDVACAEYGVCYVRMTELPWTTTDDAIALMEKAAIKLEERA